MVSPHLASSSPPAGNEAPASPEAPAGNEAPENAEASGQAEAPSASGAGLWPYLRERYFSLDRRLLGLFRIYFGFLLLFDTLRRIPDSTFFYSNEGILSNHYSLYTPMLKPYFSLFTAFSTPNEVKVALVLTAVAHGFYIVGYRTRIAQLVSLVLVASLNIRNHFVENGGAIMVTLLAVWTLFLPLGDRFSVDALLKSLRERRDLTAASLNDRTGLQAPQTLHVTLVAFCILFQISVCYFFNTIHKFGETWTSGEAVHWVLWQNRIATSLTGWLRMHEPSWFSPLATRGTLLIEGMAPVLVLLPFWASTTRTVHFLITSALHLGIASLFSLGSFSYVMLALNALALPPAAIDWLSEWIGRNLSGRVVVYSPADAGFHLVARVLARLDSYGMLSFVDRADSKNLPPGAPKASIAVYDEESERWTVGTAALASAARSLPFGELWGPMLGNAVGQALLRFVLLRRARIVESTGLEAGQPWDLDAPGYELVDRSAPWRDHVQQTAIAVRESMVTVLLATAFFQAMHDNWRLPPRLRLDVPVALQIIPSYLRFFQGWSMFSPDAPRSDGTLVVDGITADGRHLDPLTGQEPDFEAPFHGPWHQSQLWCDYLLKITFDQHKNYREEFRRYLLNWHRIENRPPNDRLVSFEVYWVSNDAPPPGSTVISNVQRRLFLSSR